MKSLSALSLVAILLGSSGCGTAWNQHDNHRVYGGVREEAAYIGEAFSSSGPRGAHLSDVPFLMLDFPLTFLGDTVYAVPNSLAGDGEKISGGTRVHPPFWPTSR